MVIKQHAHLNANEKRVAHLTLTSYSGNEGSFIPSNAAQRIGPSSSKCRSALLLTIIPVLSSNVAKFDCMWIVQTIHSVMEKITHSSINTVQYTVYHIRKENTR
jgi:hypothetical protein